MHLDVGRTGQRVALPVRGLQERRRRLSHPLPHPAYHHRSADVLLRDGARPVQRPRQHQGVEVRAGVERARLRPTHHPLLRHHLLQLLNGADALLPLLLDGVAAALDLVRSRLVPRESLRRPHRQQHQHVLCRAIL